MFGNTYDRNRDEREELNSATDSGPALCQSVPELYASGKYTYNEIAAKWGITRGTVAGILRRKGLVKKTHKRGGNLNVR